MKKQLTGVGVLLLLVTGCTTQMPQIQQQPSVVQTPVAQPQPTTNANGVKVTPYDVPEIKSKPVVIVPKQTPIQTGNDGSQIPAFKTVLAQAQQAFVAKDLERAEQLGLQAQRLAPQSSRSYTLLAQVALAKNKLPQAKSLAQRGLSLTSDRSVKIQLWQIILRTAQLQNDATAVQKAQSTLNTL